MEFKFQGFNRIIGDEIDLLIEEQIPGDDSKRWVPAYEFSIVLHGASTVLGRIGIRIGYQESLYYGGHIGYSVLGEYRGHHYAGKACKLIKEVALEHGMSKLFITCNPDNYPSRKTCEYIGATMIEIVDLPPHNDMYQAGDRQKCIYEWILNEQKG